MSNSIELLILPYGGDYSAVIPKKLFEYVLPYAPLLSDNNGNKAFAGSLIYKKDKLPVIDLTYINNKQENKQEYELEYDRHRIVILTSINSNSFCKNYAIISSEPPSIISLKEENIKEIDDEQQNIFYSKIKIISGDYEIYTNVLDPEKLEEKLFSKK